MRTVLAALLAGCVLAAALPASAQAASDESESRSASQAENGIPVERLIELVAKKTGKRFVLDPRVRANVVLVGLAPSELTYAQLLSVLAVYGFIAVDDGSLVRVLPDASARIVATPTITSRDTHLPDEIVTELVQVKYLSAPQLVPILRPMVPQYGHLVAYPMGNVLLVTDRFENVRRLEGIIRAMDVPGNQTAPHPATGTDASPGVEKQ
jgi:general secretion pathway protein D